MNVDWKDALGALMDSGSIPIDNTPDSVLESESESTSKQKNILHVLTDKKGRKGKTATIIEGLTLPDKEVEELAKTLKQKLGVGGSTRNGEILIQGDRKEDVIRVLNSLGYKTK